MAEVKGKDKNCCRVAGCLALAKSGTGFCSWHLTADAAENNSVKAGIELNIKQACAAIDCPDARRTGSIYCYEHSVQDKKQVDVRWQEPIPVPDDILLSSDIAILNEAKYLIGKARPEEYGEATDNFQNTADLLRVLVRARYGHDIAFTPDFIALMMSVAVKGAREAFKHKHDNVLDAIGYAALIEKVVQR